MDCFTGQPPRLWHDVGGPGMCLPLGQWWLLVPRSNLPLIIASDATRLQHVHVHQTVFIQGPMSRCKACHGKRHLVLQPCRNRYLVVLQDHHLVGGLAGSKGQRKMPWMPAAMMQFGALCRQYKTSPFLTRGIFQNSNCKCCGGCSSSVRTAVLFALRIKPTCDKTVTKSFNSDTVSAYDFANDRISLAKRRSNSAGSPSPKSNPFGGASRFRAFITHCSTAENTGGLGTHPCFTPEIFGQLRTIAVRSPLATHFS